MWGKVPDGNFGRLESISDEEIFGAINSPSGPSRGTIPTMRPYIVSYNTPGGLSGFIPCDGLPEEARTALLAAAITGL